MRQFKKDGKIYNAPIKLNLDDKIVFTTNQKLLSQHGFEVYTPPAPVYKQPELTTLRFNKRKVKNLLSTYGVWDTVKELLSEDAYEDLILSEDFAFDDPLFQQCYDSLKINIAAGAIEGVPSDLDIDQLLRQCTHHSNAFSKNPNVTPDDPEKIIQVTIKEYDKAMENYIKHARVKRGYTTREPDCYINSKNKRWQQDAQDFIDFRDAVMEYGLQIMNEYQKTRNNNIFKRFQSRFTTNNLDN